MTATQERSSGANLKPSASQTSPPKRPGITRGETSSDRQPSGTQSSTRGPRRPDPSYCLVPKGIPTGMIRSQESKVCYPDAQEKGRGSVRDSCRFTRVLSVPTLMT